jgi:hypothetical protein
MGLDASSLASLVCFLAGAEPAYVNGVVWLIYGGSLAWRGFDPLS